MATQRPTIIPTAPAPLAPIHRIPLIGIWDHLWAAIATTVVIAALAGASIAMIMPRGPVTGTQALLLMLTGLLTGLAAGFVLRSRWAMAIAPLIQLLAFELTRIGEAGPTVDGIHLDTTFGIMAFVVGRGVYGVLTIPPILLGVAYGVALARRLAHDTSPTRGRWHSARLYARRGVATVCTIGMVGLAIWIAIPASVAPVSGPDGEPIEGSIAELTSLQTGGNEQWLEIRGASEELPVLLYISGGPGQSDLALSRALLDDLTQDVIFVGWDQRGNGKSYADWDASTMTLDRAVSDTIEVTNYLRKRFDEDKIYILGESWGTTLGVLAVQQHPELYHAFIGSGQMVSQRETDRLIYQDLLAYAEREDDEELARQLREFGPPPYADTWAYGVVMQNYEKIEGEYDPPQAYTERGETSGVGFWGVMGSEYTPIDKANLFRGLIDTFDVMYPQLQEIDFREDVPTLAAPVYILDGEHELRGRRELAHEWFRMLDAPVKEMYSFENAGHAVAFEHADDLHSILADEILPATYANG